MATCTITNTLTKPDGTPIVGVPVVAVLYPAEPPQATFTPSFVEIPPLAAVNTVTDNSGHWTLTLERTDTLIPAGMVYQITEKVSSLGDGIDIVTYITATGNADTHLYSNITQVPATIPPVGVLTLAGDGLEQAGTTVSAKAVRQIRIGTRDANPGGYVRLQPLPGLTAQAVTVTTTQTGVSPGWTLGGEVFDATTAPTPGGGTVASPGRYFGGKVAHAVSGGQNYVSSAGMVSVGGGAAVYPTFYLEIETDAPAIEIAEANEGGQILFLLDGLWVSQTPTTLATDHGTTVFKLSFADRRPRRLTVVHRGLTGECRFKQLRIQVNDSIWTSHAQVGPRVLVAGDDFALGTGSTWRDLTAFWGDLLGWRDVWNISSPGTGYVAAGTRVNLQSRYAADINGTSPDIVALFVGQADEATSAATVQTAVAAVCNGIRNQIPRVKLIVVGPLSITGSPLAAAMTTRDAIQSGALGIADVFLDPIGGTIPYDGTAGHYANSGVVGAANPAAWVSGTGSTGSPTGAGNGDVLVTGSNFNQAGHLQLAHWLAGATAAAMPF